MAYAFWVAIESPVDGGGIKCFDMESPGYRTANRPVL